MYSTALQAGRSMVRFPIVSLQFFSDIIIPATMREVACSIPNGVIAISR